MAQSNFTNSGPPDYVQSLDKAFDCIVTFARHLLYTGTDYNIIAK
jgi:hypothetical protein